MNQEKIAKMMEKGYNCSQVVFCYFADRFGMDSEMAMKISTPFEMGMYNSEKCGALTAGYMVLGLRYGTTDFNERLSLARKMIEFNKKFLNEMKSSNCKELLGMKVLEGDNMKKAAEEGLLESVCGSSIVNAINILEDLL